MIRLKTSLVVLSDRSAKMDSKYIKEKIKCGEFKLRIKRKGKSELWTLFGEIENESGVIIDGWLCCRECKNIYKYNGKQTSNLNRHKCFMQKQNNVNTPSKKLSAEDKTETINVLTNWVIEDCRPFSAVSGSGFHKMAQFFIKLGAKYGDNIDVDDLIPEPTTISKTINKIAEQQKNKYKEIIPKIVGQNDASMTIDMWTDAYIKRNFLCATFHYHENFIMKEIVLGLKSMDFLTSSGNNIKQKLKGMLDEFGVSDFSKIRFITDRGSNVKKALQYETRLNCSNHLLSNVVDAAFEANEEILQISVGCKNLVKYFKKSNLQHLLPTTLKNHCPTRWNSMLNLFKSICDNWCEINTILIEQNATHRVSHINYNTLKSLKNICIDIDKISRKLQGSKYPTLCYVIPSISRLKIICTPNSDDAQVVVALKEHILREVEMKWIPNIGIWHQTASFLFPPTNNMQELQQAEIKQFCLEQIKIINSETQINTSASSVPVSPFDSLPLSPYDSLSLSPSNDPSVTSVENSTVSEIPLLINWKICSFFSQILYQKLLQYF